jgi:hypothetical protein
MLRLKSLLYGGFIGTLMGVFFYLVPAKLLVTGALPVNGVMLPPGMQSNILADAMNVGGPIGLVIGLFFGLIVTIPRPPLALSPMIASISLIVTWVVAFTRYGSNLKDFSAGHIVIFALWLVGTMFIALPMIVVWLGSLEPSSLLRPPSKLEE